MNNPDTGSLSQHLKRLPLKQRLRSVARDSAIFLLSLKPRDISSSEWIRFPYYHHVFDEERKGFDRHLRFMKNMGEFIGLDDAVDMLVKNERISGRYFSITFDDGFKNILTNALPILHQHSCPASVFIPTDHVGNERKKDVSAHKQFHIFGESIEFLDWDDCRKLLSAGVEIGSHTLGHVRLSELSPEQVRQELSASKKIIEEKLGIECGHFSCPYGTPGKDFIEARDPGIARDAGYHSFITTKRGANLQGGNPYFILRDHVMAGWGTYQLRYFYTHYC